jgi:hypothetical protein
MAEAGGALALAERDGRATVDPWPFAADELGVRCEGRRLAERCDTTTALHAALERAPRVEMRFVLARA